MPTPTQAAIDLLRKSPDKAAQFDEVFGQGASKKYAAPAEAGGGVLETAGNVASDIGKGVTEAPGAIVRGAENAVNETSNAAHSAAGFLNEHVADLGQITVDHTGVHWSHGMPAKNDAQIPQAVTPDEPTSTTGHLIEGVSQFSAGMVGAGKFLKAFGVGGAASAAGKFATTMGKAAIADATVFDPHADRLSNLIQSNPALENPVTSFLAAKPTDGEALGRFKNSLEGFISGAALESFVHGVKAIKLARTGDLKGAAEAADTAGVKHTEANTPPPEEPPGAAPEGQPTMSNLANMSKEQLQQIADNGPRNAEIDSESVVSREAAQEVLREHQDWNSYETPNLVDVIRRTVIENREPDWIAKVRDGKADGRADLSASYVRLKGATDALRERGYDFNQLPGEMLNSLKERGWNPADAREVLGARLTDIQGQRPKPALEAPAAGTPAAAAKRDTMDVTSKPLPFRLSPQELDQYGKNLDSRFTVGGEEMANIGQHFNFDKINTSDDIKAAINSMANVVQPKVSELLKGDQGDVRTWESVNKHAGKIAEITGGDPRLMVQHLSSLSNSVQHLDAMMKASGDMLVTLSGHSDKLAQMVASEAPGEFGDMKTLMGAYSHSTQLLGNTYALLKNVQTNVARAQNAGKIVRQVNPVFKRGVEAIGPEDEMLLRQLAKRQAAAAGDPASTRKLLEGSLFDRALAVHNEFWFNAVLSGAKTHVVNTTVNTAKALFMPAEQMVAGVIGRNSAQFLEGAYMYAGMAEQLKSALQMAGKSFKIADNVLDFRQAYEGAHKQAITGAMFGAKQGSNLETIVNGLGTTVRIPSRMLMAEDEFFKQLTYRSRIYASAMREGVQMGLNPEGVGQLVARRLDEAFDPNGHANLVDDMGRQVASRVNALKSAREATFTQPLDYGIGRWIEQGAQAHPFIRIIMPFVRVPTNIIRDFNSHVPGLGLLQKQMREDLAAGGERANMAMAKQATGTAIWTTATMYALEGKITGYGPTDPQARKAWLLDNQPYSFVSTDENGKKTFTSFNRVDPYGMPLGLVADFAHIGGQLGDMDKEDFAKAAIIALTNNLASKTYLQGLIQFVNVLSDDRQTKLDQWLEQRAASYIPNAMSMANPDPYFREVRGMLDAMQAKIPGFASNLPARRDVFGEPMNVPMGWPFDAINPFTVKSTEADPAKMEMARLSSSDAGIRFPLPQTKTNGLDLTQIKGDDGVSVYDKWQQNIGEMSIGGKTMHDKLNEVVQSQRYQDAADGNAVFKKSRKVDMIMEVMDRYRTRALHETMKDFPEVNQAVRDFKRGAKRVRHGQAPGNDPFAVFNQ